MDDLREAVLPDERENKTKQSPSSGSAKVKLYLISDQMKLAVGMMHGAAELASQVRYSTRLSFMMRILLLQTEARL